MWQGGRRRLLLLIATALAIFLLAEVAPRLLIHSSMEEFADVEGPSMQCAGLAYMHARLMVSGGPEAFIWTALRVVEVTHLLQEEAEGCECPYEIRVRVYTLFGIPYDTIVARCSGGYRLYQPFGPPPFKPPQ